MTSPLVDAARIQAWDEDFVQLLRQALDRAGYGPDLLSRCERIAPRRFDAVRLPLVLDFLRGLDGPAAVATRLFAYGDRLRPAELEPWLPPDSLAILTEAGWLTRDAEGISSTVRVLPFFGLWLAADEAPGRADPVMPPGATTQELAHALPGEISGRLLDVGCGCGALALVAARRGADATGIDIDPRAVAWSRFNARLNRLEARFVESDLFAALGDERFDIVVAQPPYVPQPTEASTTTYLHGGERGDELTLRMLADIAPRIERDGRAVVLFDAPEDETPLWKRVRAAIDDEDLDVVVIASEGHTAEHASIGYAAAAYPELSGGYAETAIHYRQHLRRVGVDRFFHTMLVLSRRAQEGARASVTLTPKDLTDYDYAGLMDLERALLVASLPREDLLKKTVGAAPGSVLVQKDPLAQTDGVGLEVEFRHGRGQNSALSDAAAVLLQLARQRQTVNALVLAFADAADANVEDVQSSVLSFVRDGLIRGLLTVS